MSVIYEIEADPTIVMADISGESQFPSEEEVLFDLGVTFKVISMKCDAKETYWIVQLKATADGSLLANEFLNYNQYDLKADKAVEILHGELLIEIDEFTKSRRFFEDLAKYQPTADTYYYLGRTCSFMGEYDRSAMFFQLAFSELQKDRHPKSIDMVQVLRGIGLLYTLQGDFELARETYEKALQQGKELFPNKEHYEFALVFNNMASVLEDQGKYDDAVKNLEQMLVICDHIRLPSNHPVRAVAHDNSGNIYATLKKYDLSLKYQLDALSIRLKLLPRGHFAFGGNFKQLGRIFVLKKHFECAQICLKVAQEIISVSVPDNQLMRAEYLLQLGDLNQQKRQFRRALVFYQLALSARQKVLPSDHHDIGFVYEKIGDGMRALGRTEEANESYQRVLNICIDELSPDHSFIANLKQVLPQLI